MSVLKQLSFGRSSYGRHEVMQSYVQDGQTQRGSLIINFLDKRSSYIIKYVCTPWDVEVLTPIEYLDNYMMAFKYVLDNVYDER
jgi:hypothetical protein